MLLLLLYSHDLGCLRQRLFDRHTLQNRLTTAESGTSVAESIFRNVGDPLSIEGRRQGDVLTTDREKQKVDGKGDSNYTKATRPTAFRLIQLSSAQGARNSLS